MVLIFRQFDSVYFGRHLSDCTYPQKSTILKLIYLPGKILHATSNQEVAEQLRAIAQDKRMPENVRAEALGHGVILDLPVFVNMAADTQLPEAMAKELFQHVVNENGNPALQIRAYMDFLNHSSSEIREESKGLLAFVLEDDKGEADEATLIQMADAKLKQIEAE
jgi:hypothetical protein